MFRGKCKHSMRNMGLPEGGIHVQDSFYGVVVACNFILF